MREAAPSPPGTMTLAHVPGGRESSVQGPGRGPAAGPLPINGPYALWDSLRTRPQSLCALISLSRTPLLRNSAEDEVTEGPGRHSAGGGPSCV